MVVILHNFRVSKEEMTETQEFYRIIIELTLAFFAFFKILYFIRIYDSFGFLVQMVSQTIIETIPFNLFLGFWILLFGISYQILNVEVEGDPTSDDLEYPEVSNFIKFMIQSYRNSIGDINTPDYG